MSIRSKLAWTFIILLTFGITAISSYSILFIRDYLWEEGQDELKKDSRWMAVTIENLPADSLLQSGFRQAADIADYEVALYDRDGILFSTYPDSGIADTPAYLPDDLQVRLEARGDIPILPASQESEKLISYVFLEHSANATQFIRVSKYKDELYAPIKNIRWIIYYGMFISIILVVGVSIWISRYLTKPITQIKDAAQQIARGDVDRKINIERSDEFGTLAESLNRMASRLRADIEQIKEYAEKQQQFFADITHEIRNPLHTISGALEMLEMDNLSGDKKQKYLANAKKQTVRINRLFKDLLTLQRYDSDERFIEKKEFDLAEITPHLEELFNDQARKKGLDLKIDTHSCKTTGDPGKIEQVFENLISNAVKYTSEGEIKVNYEKKTNRVEVEIADTGIGISEEHLDRLFDRFYRTDKARSRDKGGTGLGLAVVKSILNAHGSEIEVESEVGKGTVFRFDLPGEK